MVEQGRPAYPAMDRDEIIARLQSEGFFTKVDLEHKFMIYAATAVPKLLARLHGNAAVVRRLNDAEMVEMADLFAIIQDDEQWEELNPVEKRNLRQRLSDLAYRKAINP